MRLSVIGCGYLGAVHAACMADLGHDVVGVEVVPEKVEKLAQGEAPFYEAGLPELLRSGLDAGTLRFTPDIAEVADATVHFICVGTPQRQGEMKADLSYVWSAVDGLLPHLSPGDLVVGKSTVPVGTAERIAAQVSQVGATLIWNPEFLREGKAVADTLHPDRIVYGVPDDTDDQSDGATGGAERAVAVLDEVYAEAIGEGIPRLLTDLTTAQLVKVAANSFLATKISFINAMAELCETAGGDVVSLADAIGMDERIGRSFLNAGLGFGGGCLPKDIRAFMARAGELGADQTLTFLREVDAINMRRRVRMVDLAREALGGSLAGRRIAVLGAAFKPESDDVRDSPALSVAAQMQLQGAEVRVTDPQALPNVARSHPDLHLRESVAEAAKDAELVLVLTEWQEYRDLAPEDLDGVVGNKRILDGRNCLDPATWRAAGWTYRALGRR